MLGDARRLTLVNKTRSGKYMPATMHALHISKRGRVLEISASVRAGPHIQ